MTFEVEAVDCQTNPDTGRWSCVAVVRTPPKDGQAARRWMVSFVPETHPESVYVITGLARDDAGRPLMQMLDLDALQEGVVVNASGEGLLTVWLPTIAGFYLDAQCERLRFYARSYAERNAADPDPNLTWRRDELIVDNMEELELLDGLRSYLFGFSGSDTM